MDDEFEWLQKEDLPDRARLIKDRLEPQIIEEYVRENDIEWLEKEDPPDRYEILRKCAWNDYYARRHN